MVTPKNEIELIVLFVQESDNNIFITSIDGFFPDAIVSWNNKEYRTEFEYRSSNFWLHKHNPIECDLIICWENDDLYPVLPVIELKNVNWKQTEIELVRPQEKMAGYWKMRALISEENLSVKQMQVVRAQVAKQDKYTPESDAIFVRLVQDGQSKNQASIGAYGRGYAGNLVERGKRLLGEI